MKTYLVLSILIVAGALIAVPVIESWLSLTVM